MPYRFKEVRLQAGFTTVQLAQKMDGCARRFIDSAREKIHLGVWLLYSDLAFDGYRMYRSLRSLFYLFGLRRLVFKLWGYMFITARRFNFDYVWYGVIVIDKLFLIHPRSNVGGRYDCKRRLRLYMRSIYAHIAI